jgi:hypothetical protein
MGLFWPVGEMGGIAAWALTIGATLGALVGGAVRYGVVSTATVVGLVFAVFLGAWAGPGCDDRSGMLAIPGFVLAWASYSAFAFLTRNVGPKDS